MFALLAHSLFFHISCWMHRELARQVEYLKAENQILRSKLPQRITVTEQERATLLSLGKLVGKALAGLISIVTWRTFTRWLAQENEDEKKPAKPKRKPGPKPTPLDVKQLIVKLAKENDWGYTRILGELKKLKIDVSRSTVVNVLRENGLSPGPKTGKGSWDAWLRRNWSTLWACDFFTVPVWTLLGRVDVFVLFFLHVGSRRAYIPCVTTNPTAAWTTQQARNFSMHLQEAGQTITLFLRDRDSKFTDSFDRVIESDGAEVKAVGPLAPNMNAHAERFVQTIKGECLNHFTFFGEKHLCYVMKEWLEHYHTERPHQGVGNVPLGQQAADSAGPEATTLPFQIEDVICEERLGGLIRHYRRAA